MSADRLHFNTSTVTSLINDFPAGTWLAGLQFEAAAPSYTFFGDPIVLSHETAAFISNLSASPQSFQANLSLGGPTVINPGGTSVSLVNVSGVGSLAKTGSGTLSLAGSLTHTGGTTLSAGTTVLTGTLHTGNSANFTVGDAAGAKAVVHIDGGTLTAAKPSSNPNQFSVQIGAVPDAVGAMRITAGNMTVNGQVLIGELSTSSTYGAFSQTGGTVNVLDYFVIAHSGDAGVFQMSGGTLTCSRQAFIVSGGFSTGSSTAVADISGGRIAANATDRAIFVGEYGYGVLNISGTAVVATPGKVEFGNRFTYAGAGGVVNLRGGTLTSNGVIHAVAGTGPSAVNFHGGTFKAAATGTFLFTGVGGLFIYEEGATFDDSGRTISISQPLLAPTGNGLTSVPFTGGTGYVAPPIVQISMPGGGPNASPATASAFIDDQGNLTAITVTNPGTGYTAAPTITLLGGGGTGAQLLGAPIAPNAPAGALTKNGTGILSFNGIVSFGGPVVINSGTVGFNNVATVGQISGPGHLRAGASITSDGVVDVSSWFINGTHTIRAGGGQGRTSKTRSLLIAGSASAWTGKLDLKDNAIIVQSVDAATKVSRIPTLQDQIAFGAAGGAWTGKGITSSTLAEAAAAGTPQEVLALADNGDLGMTVFRGQVVDEYSLIIAPARPGDANLDRKVDAFDLNLLAAHWQQAAGALWSAGDFNGDGKVDAFDLNLLAGNWQFGAGGGTSIARSGGPAAALAVLVPEPATVGLLAVGAGLACIRRRDRSGNARRR